MIVWLSPKILGKDLIFRQFFQLFMLNTLPNMIAQAQLTITAEKLDLFKGIFNLFRQFSRYNLCTFIATYLINLNSQSEKYNCPNFRN